MIGYIGLARETFDVKFAEEKFQQSKKVLFNITSKTLGIDFLVTNDELSIKALKFFEKKNFSKVIIFQTTFTDAKFLLNFVKVAVRGAGNLFPVNVFTTSAVFLPETLITAKPDIPGPVDKA